MFAFIARLGLNIFYYLGGFLMIGIAYFFLYNSNVIVYRFLQLIGVSKGKDRQFKSIRDVRDDMKLLIDSLYKLADSADLLVKLAVGFFNNWWMREN